MLGKDYFTSARNGDFNAIMEIGKKKYTAIDNSNYNNIGKTILTTTEFEEVAKNISNIEECYDFYLKIKDAINSGLIKTTSSGKVKSASLAEYLSNRRCPTGLRVYTTNSGNTSGELMAEWNTGFSSDEFYDKKFLNNYKLEELYPAIVEIFISHCYKLYLMNDEYCKLNSEAYKLFQQVHNVLKFEGIGWTSSHNGNLIVFSKDSTKHRKPTENELKLIISKSKALIEAAGILEVGFEF